MKLTKLATIQRIITRSLAFISLLAFALASAAPGLAAGGEVTPGISTLMPPVLVSATRYQGLHT